jgi:hypothetical protein
MKRVFCFAGGLALGGAFLVAYGLFCWTLCKAFDFSDCEISQGMYGEIQYWRNLEHGANRETLDRQIQHFSGGDRRFTVKEYGELYDWYYPWKRDLDREAVFSE